MRAPTLTLAILTVFSTILLFTVKYRVQMLNDKLLSIDAQIVADRETIHVLKAEWSHLNEPERLLDLATRHLDLQLIDSSRILKFEKLNEKLPTKNLAVKNQIKMIGRGGIDQ